MTKTERARRDALILLDADRGYTAAEIAERRDVSKQTALRIARGRLQGRRAKVLRDKPARDLLKRLGMDYVERRLK